MFIYFDKYCNFAARQNMCPIALHYACPIFKRLTILTQFFQGGGPNRVGNKRVPRSDLFIFFVVVSILVIDTGTSPKKYFFITD